MSRLGDRVRDDGVEFAIVFDGRQSLLGARVTQEPVIPIGKPRRPRAPRRRHYTRRRPRLARRS